MDGTLILSQTLLLERFPGKGGWTYVELKSTAADQQAKPSAWVKVNGSIDGFEISQATLMPMGKGRLFLPVKAEIRKSVGKQLGDEVLVVLYADAVKDISRDEILACLQDEKKAFEAYSAMQQTEQEALFAWINAGKTEDQKVERIAKAVKLLPVDVGFFGVGRD